jgi:hypothetical protein
LRASFKALAVPGQTPVSLNLSAGSLSSLLFSPCDSSAQIIKHALDIPQNLVICIPNNGKAKRIQYLRTLRVISYGLRMAIAINLNNQA